MAQNIKKNNLTFEIHINNSMKLNLKRKFNWDVLINLGLFLLLVQIILYAKIRFGLHFFSETPSGDESKYLEDILFYKENGLYLSIVKGVSITYLIFSAFVEEFVDNPLLSIRITSLISSLFFLVVTIIIERKYFRLSLNYRNVAYISILYVIVLQNSLFNGINDLLLDFFGSFVFLIIFLEMNNQENSLIRSKKNFLLIGVFIALMICTRKMALVYIPSFLFILILIRKTEPSKLVVKASYLFIGFIVVLFLLNYPSIKENGKLSFDDKILKADVNWSQFDYYNMLMIHKGKGIRGKHVNIKEVKNYIDINGTEALPTTFYEMIFFDIKLTLIEFLHGLKSSFIGFLRSLGLLFLLGLCFIKIKKGDLLIFKIKNPSNVIILFGLSFTLLISFIVISYIQFRWFMIFLPLIIISFLSNMEELKMNSTIKNILLLLHILSLFIMNIPYLLRIFIPDFVFINPLSMY